MNTIIGKLGKSSKFKDLVNKIEEKKWSDSNIGPNWRWKFTIVKWN